MQKLFHPDEPGLAAPIPAAAGPRPLSEQLHLPLRLVWLAVAALAVGLGALGTAWAQSRIGAAGAGTLAEKPELLNSIFLILALPETIVVLGFVVAAMILLL